MSYNLWKFVQIDRGNRRVNHDKRMTVPHGGTVCYLWWNSRDQISPTLRFHSRNMSFLTYKWKFLSENMMGNDHWRTKKRISLFVFRARIWKPIWRWASGLARARASLIGSRVVCSRQATGAVWNPAPIPGHTVCRKLGQKSERKRRRSPGPAHPFMR